MNLTGDSSAGLLVVPATNRQYEPIAGGLIVLSANSANRNLESKLGSGTKKKARTRILVLNSGTFCRSRCGPLENPSIETRKAMRATPRADQKKSTNVFVPTDSFRTHKLLVNTIRTTISHHTYRDSNDLEERNRERETDRIQKTNESPEQMTIPLDCAISV